MAEQIGGATYALDLDSAQFMQGAKQAETTKQQLVNSFKQVDQASASSAKNLGSAGSAAKDTGKQFQILGLTTGNFAREATAAALGVGALSVGAQVLKHAFSSVIGGASDLNEAINENAVVFGRSGDAVVQWSQKSATAFGLSQAAALQATGTIGALLETTGLAPAKVAPMAESLVQLAGDLASFYNQNPNDVLQALQAGLIGEVRPLRDLGINLLDTTVRAKGMALGLADSTGALTDAALMQARYAVIMEQSAIPQGDFARTSGALANSSRILSAEIADTSATLGGQFTPAVTLGVHGVTDLLVGMNKLRVIQNVFPELALGVGVFGAALVALQIAAKIREVQQLELAIGAMSGGQANLTGVLTAGLGTRLASAIFTPVGAAVALTTALVGVDVAARHFTGSGIIDYLDGEAAAHKKAAEAAKAQAAAQDELNQLIKEGATPAQAADIAVQNAIAGARKVQAAWDAANQARIDALKGNVPSGGATGPVAVPLPLTAPQAIAPIAPPDFTKQIAEIRAAQLDYAALNDTINQLPQASQAAFRDALAPDLAAAAKAAGDLAVSLYSVDKAISDAKTKEDEFTTAVSDMKSLSTVFDPQLEALKLEKLQLESLKTSMGAAFGDANQARLDEITRRVDLLTNNQDRANASIDAFAAMVRQQYGELAPAAIQRVTALLSALPDDQKIKLDIILPDLFQIQSVFQNFIAALQAGASIDVAVRIGAEAAFPGSETTIGQRPSGAGGPLGQTDVITRTSSAAQSLIDSLTQKENQLNTAQTKLGPSATSAAAGLSHLDQVMQAVSDGTITLAEKTALGLTDEQVVTLELTKAHGDLEEKLYRERIGLMELAAAFPGVTGAQVQYILGMQAIADHLKATGQTVAQFLHDVNAGVLQTAQSALDALLGGPTKESAQMQLRLDELQRQRALLLRSQDTNSPAVKALDKQIAALQNEQQIRQLDLDIMKQHAILADQTLRTDRQLANAYTWLIGVIGVASTALINFSSFLDDFSGKGTGAVPSFDVGTPFVPHTMLAVVHRGERIIPAAQNAPRLLGAGTPAVNLVQNFTINADASDAAIDRLARKVRDASNRGIQTAMRGGAYPTSGINSGR